MRVGLFSLATFGVVAIFLDMPNCRAPDKLATRRERARCRGYLATVRPGHRHVMVPQSLRGRVKAQVSALLHHQTCNDLTGTPHHFGTTAAMAARPLLGPETTAQMLRVHRSAARARHSWKQPSASSLTVLIATPSGRRSCWADLSEPQNTGDDIFDKDPWLLGLRAAPCGDDPCMTSRLAEIKARAPWNRNRYSPDSLGPDSRTLDLRPEAVPSAPPARSGATETCGSESLAWQSLVDAQNCTIQYLEMQVAYLQSLLPAGLITTSGAPHGTDAATQDASLTADELAVMRGQLRALSDKVIDLASSVGELARSLPSAVECSVASRTPGFATTADLREHHNATKDLVLDMINVWSAQLPKTVTDASGEFLRKSSAVFHERCDQIAASLRKEMNDSIAAVKLSLADLTPAFGPDLPAAPPLETPSCPSSVQSDGDNMADDDYQHDSPLCVGACVRVHGLCKATHYNDRIGTITHDADHNGRYGVCVDGNYFLRVLADNLEFPARCPGCDSEISSSTCFACDFYSRGHCDGYGDSHSHDTCVKSNVRVQTETLISPSMREPSTVALPHGQRPNTVQI